MPIRLNQPPVPSVAHAEEVTTDVWALKPKHDNPLNEVCEAYTGNAMGHRSGRTAPKLLAPTAMIKRKATVSLYRKPTRKSRHGEAREIPPGFRGVARSESKDKNLGGPLVSLQGREGHSNRRKERPKDRGSQIAS